MKELSFVFFQAVLGTTFLACVLYLVFFVSQNGKVRKVARMILILSGVLQTLYIGSRLLLAGYTPITSAHEAVMFFAWATTLAYLSFRWRYTVKNFGTFVSWLIMFLLIAAAMASREILPLKPVLQSWYLPIHASLSLFAYAFFSLAFCGALMYLLQERELKRKTFGYFFARLPSLDALDQLNSHCVAAGFVFMTLGIVTGSLWTKQASGTYWQWHPKEIWSMVTWILYLVMIHQRFTAGWRGKRTAIMAVAGFATLLFTLLGVMYPLGGA
ncbi:MULTISPECIES: cytochrome c biogenesis protein CcsA [Desulfosediminicola]|uniref:cytochrome c biogenesis protein CcsA n=1 Tax=Desulfosediminicola TaxID=2886823 RepID=UPI0010ACF047|nr:cytochrome c biogenesis protein CcsA [Desulfosediminicola ganghwensis]